MKIIITEGERGVLFKNGRYLRVLTPGKFRFFGMNFEVMRLTLGASINTSDRRLDGMLNDKSLENIINVVEVPDETLALHYLNGCFYQALASGRHAFWNINQKHEFRYIDIREPMAGPDVSPSIFSKIPSKMYTCAEVQAHQKGRFYCNGKFVQLLKEGTYYFWKNGSNIEVNLVDTRLLQMNVQGQEMLTLDKVALRINFVCRYRITDYEKAFTEVEDYQEQIRVMAQLALREYVGRNTLDALLENKEQLAGFVLNQLKEKESVCYISFLDAGVKDMILPGEVRDIMNTVLIAEKRAQANVITRREEVASTRSLLNTAKLMEENPTLLHLKELESLEKICENVGNITVNGGGDLLGQLAAVLRSRTEAS